MLCWAGMSAEGRYCPAVACLCLGEAYWFQGEAYWCPAAAALAQALALRTRNSRIPRSDCRSSLWPFPHPGRKAVADSCSPPVDLRTSICIPSTLQQVLSGHKKGGLAIAASSADISSSVPSVFAKVKDIKSYHRSIGAQATRFFSATTAF